MDVRLDAADKSRSGVVLFTPRPGDLATMEKCAGSLCANLVDMHRKHSPC